MPRPNPRHDPSGPQPLRAVLSRLLSQSGYAEQQAAESFAAAWRQACPPVFLGQSQPGLVRRGVLEVFLRHSALVQEFGFHKREVLARLRELLPAAGISDIRCRLLPEAGADAAETGT